MKELIILRGLPGSGKSTFAYLLTKDRNSVIIENDQFMYEDGIYVWKQSKLKQAVKHTSEKLNKALNDEVEYIVISNVNARESDFNHYTKIAKEKGYKVSVVIMENRAETKSRHGVPEDKLKLMEDNFEIKLK